MNRSICFILLLAFVFLFSACHKEPLTEFEAGPLMYGEISAQINGADWKASPLMDTFYLGGKIYFDFIGLTFTEEGFHRNDLNIGPVPFEKGTYTITSPRGECGNINFRGFFFLLAGDGDALAATYYIDDDKKNEVEVEEVDLVEGSVKGRFTLNFVLEEEPAPGFDFPEKLKIRKGCFDISLP